MIKKILFTLLAILFAADSISRAENLFPDPGLENCVREAIEKPSGELTVEDVSSLTHMECQNRNIYSIDGIENFKAATKLSFWENRISDISPLENLTNLIWLQLGNNEIEDIGSLSKLTNLTRLGLALNDIEDIVVLRKLTALEWLNLDNNRLENQDLTFLRNLNKLTWLTLEHNRITSISSLFFLALKGCDIHWDLQDTVRSGVNTSDFLDLNKALLPVVSGRSNFQDSPSIIDGDLVFYTDPSGVVSFRYTTDKQDLPVIKEYAGTIILEGSTFVYHTSRDNINIGEVTDDGFEICSGNYAGVCSLAIGKKHQGYQAHAPGDDCESSPIITMTLTANPDIRAGFNDIPASFFVDGVGTFMEAHDLSPYVLATPLQFDAGSCLYMATAGAMEMLMNQHLPLDQIAYKGDTDLSERYLMNAVTDLLPAGAVPDYDLTDTIYAYNYLQGSMLDRDYPFVLDDNGSAIINWENELPPDWQDLLVETPAAERTLIFAPALKNNNGRWQVALADHDILDIIKNELVSKNAPVVIVYNHFNYWHTDIIVGYDDSQDSGGCPMVVESLKYYFRTGKLSNVLKIFMHMIGLGGCLEKGVFYVRDSIYDGGPDEPDYVYNEEIPIADKYSKRIIARTYNWVLYLANHGYAIHRAK